jgi:hypothetical protein
VIDIVAKLKTPEECQVFGQNALERGREDLAIAARRKRLALLAERHDAQSEAERACLEAIYAYEDVLARKNGKTTRATRTWQMIKKHGLIAAIERAVDREADSSGYKVLAELALQDYAFESVILRYPTEFSSAAVERAQSRLKS